MTFDSFSPFPSNYTTRSAWKVSKPVAASKVTKSRRGPKAKSWTKEEETYLLESRRQSKPYRAIATHLQKTELACRLHYHQLAVVRPQQAMDLTGLVGHCPDTPASTCPSQTPELSKCRRMTSPPLDQSPLPSLTSWLDHVRHQRSMSLPIPLRERCTTPPRLNLKKDLFAFITPPTPPTSHQFSPPVSGNSTSSSTFSLPPLSGMTAASGFPSASTSPTSFTPSPTLSTGTQNSWRGHSSRWPSMDSASTRSGLMPSPATIYSNCSAQIVSTSEKCSVRALLNHDV